MNQLGVILFLGLLGQGTPEERVDDSDYEKYVAVHVKAVQSIEKSWRKDPAQSLKSLEPLLRAIETELPSKFSRLVEVTIAVRITRGIDRGDVKDRTPFFPYRLAGETALAANERGRAVAFLQKPPSSGALLAEARKSAAAAGPAPTTPAPAATPALDL